MNAEYELDAILAEEESDGKMWYLARWKGYPEHENSWGERKNYTEETMEDWRDQKMRISRGLEKPYNVAALERLWALYERATLKRKQRRRQKRIRLGLLVSEPLEPDGVDLASKSSEEYSDWEQSVEVSSPVWTAKEESTLLDALQRLGEPQWNRIVEMYGSGGSINQNLKQRTEAGLLRKAVELKEDFDANGRDFPIELGTNVTSQTGAGDDGARRSSGSKNGQKSRGSAQFPANTPHQAKERGKNLQTAKQATPGKRKDPNQPRPGQDKKSDGSKLPESPLTENASVHKGTSVAPKSNASSDVSSNPKAASPPIPRHPSLPLTKAQYQPTQSTAGKGPARIGTTSSASNAGPAINVLGKNWGAIPEKRRKSRYELKQGPEAEAKGSVKFKKLSTKRRFELAGRYEHTPDVNSLTFVNRKDGKPVFKQSEPSQAKLTEKTPFQILQERNEDQGESPTFTDSIPAIEYASVPEPEEDIDHPIPPDQARRASAVVKPVSIPTEPTAPIRRASIPIETYTQKGLSTEKSFTAPTALMSFREQQSKPAGFLRESTVPETNADTPLGRQLQRTFSESNEASHNQNGWRPEADTPALPQEVTHRRSPLPRTEHPRACATNPIADEAELLPRVSQRAASDSYVLEDGYSLFPPTVYPASPDMHPTIQLSSTDVLAEILTGAEGHSTGIVVFRGLADHDLKRIFISIREYATIFHNPANYLGSGWIVPNRDTVDRVSKVAAVLLEHASGALFFAENFTLLIYPVGCAVWKYLDAGLTTKAPSDAQLRFAMLVPMPQVRERIKGIDVPAQGVPRSIDFEDGSLNIVFKRQFGMDFSRLIARSVDRNGSKSGPAQFFLIYPPAAREEFDLVVDWIRANISATIYRYEDRGAWNHFHASAGHGVIICHASFYDYWALPYLRYALSKSINMFKCSLEPMSASGPDPHLIRLFPAGAAILFTDSFFVLRPMDAARIMSWYRLSVLPSKPSNTQKICMRPAIREWLLRLEESCQSSESQSYVSCYKEILQLLPSGMAKQGYNRVPNDEAPVACMSEGMKNFDLSLGTNTSIPLEKTEEDIIRNDLTLSLWFAGWAMLKQEKFRRFHVITGRGEDTEQQRKLKDKLKKFNHVAIYSFEKFVQTHNVWDWPRLQKEDERRIKEAEEEEKERMAYEDASADPSHGDTEMKDVEAAGESLFLPMDTS
ncbi:MAG: hypothetical protein Q9222_001461 [Ikaeria aurantiellina]